MDGEWALHLRHSSFSNPSLALSMSQIIVQPFRCFTYVTAHFPTLLSLLLRHRIFTYVTWRAAHDILRSDLEDFLHSNKIYSPPTLPSLYLCHISFSNPSVTSPTSQHILQPLFCFSYVTGFSLTSPGEPPMPTSLIHSTTDSNVWRWPNEVETYNNITIISCSY